MVKAFAIIKKNLKLITRTKSSALIVVLGPLLLILLIGAAFNTANIYGIRVGTYSESYSSLTNAVIDELHKKRFSTVKIESVDVCIESIEQGIVHVCAIFPPDLSVKDGGDIVFYVDNSRLNLVYIVLDTLSSIVGTKSEELSTQLTKTLIDALDTADKEITDKQSLLDALASDASITDKKLDALRSVWNEVDLESDNGSSFKVLENEVSKLPGSNESKDTVAGLIEKVKRELKKKDESLIASSTAKQKTLNELTNLKQVVEGNIGYIASLDESAKKVSQEIKNVKTTSISKIVSPLKTRIEPITKNKTHLNYVFPTLVVLIIMFVSMMLASTLEIKEKTAKVYFKNFITPTSDALFIFSNFVTNLIIIVLQLAVLFGVALYFFKDQILSVVTNIIIIPLIIATVFILLGMVLGNVFRSEETSTLAVISLGFVFLFFSSTILPIESLPGVIGKIATFNPFFVGERLLNQVLLFQSPLQPLLPSLYILGGYIVGLIILTVVTKKIAKRRM
tara:strand:+ start:7535 stop:9061 length:1527 start_codon:yes stop_codon:yes gene_type:complete